MNSRISFPRPNFLKAKLTVGPVDLPTGKIGERGWDNTGTTEAPNVASSDEIMPPPYSLERSETMSSRILEIETNDAEPIAFWLQRKLCQRSRNVVARLGYRLRPIQNEAKKDKLSNWELDTDASGRPMKVRVHMLRATLAEESQNEAALNELGALQIIAQQNSSLADAHVVGTNLIAIVDTTIYAILPYHRDGTLLEFCQSVGNSPEPLARFLFRQILEGLKTLKTAGICHRNLSLDTIAMDGDRVDIIALGYAMRHNVTNPNKRIKRDDPTSRTTDDENLPLIPGGSNPCFIAPETFCHRNTTSSADSRVTTENYDNRVWNGFRDDLWATGLILYSMVVGIDALFAAPIAGDKRFARLCIKGDVKGETERYWRQSGKDTSLPSDDFFDLLQAMLSVDPNQRRTLENVMEHPWVTNSDISVTPTNFSAGTHPMTL